MDKESKDLWQDATKKNHVESIIELAYRLYTGDRGESVNKPEAKAFLQKAASLGSGKAYFELFKIQFKEDVKEYTPFDSTILDLLINSAKLDYEKAQVFLATEYYLGNYIKKDIAEAKFWFLKAAEQDDINAIDDLIRLYLKDNDNPEDSKNEAYQWLKKKHELTIASTPKNQNGLEDEIDAEADIEFKLGIKYYYGISCDVDYAKAMSHFLAAFELFHVEAFYYIGKMHYEGRGVPTNYEEAKRWYKLAAENGSADANYMIGAMLEHRHVKPDEEDYFAYYIYAAKLGHSEAQYKVGEMFYFGHGVKRDHAEARHYYHLAAQQNHVAAQEALSNLYFLGWGGEQSNEMAIEWMQKAVQNGSEKIKYRKLEEPFAEELCEIIF